MAETGTYDIIIIGAGIAGLQQLHAALDAGFTARILEAGEGVGGTWWWNSYPGCRFDTESYTYGYLFSDNLYRKWRWSEHFAGQPETEAYLNWVADELGLRTNIDLGCTVESLMFDDMSNSWSVVARDGRTWTAHHVIACVGRLSVPQFPNIPGHERFAGEAHHTGAWPREPVAMTGRRVGVLGVGSSGIQVATAIAGEVEHLTVFQSTPNWSSPLHNRPITDDEWDELVHQREELLTICNDSPSGTLHRPFELSAHAVSPEKRKEVYADMLAKPGFGKLFGNFRELSRDEGINQEFCEVLAKRIREEVTDPEIAEKLIPRSHRYGVRRPPHDEGYYKIFNRENVTLVDLADEPIIEMDTTGIVTSKASYPLDLIIYATGFDAITGAIEKIDIRAGGKRLKDEWEEGPRTLFGLQTPSFPNFFIINGPQSGGANAPRSISPQVEAVVRLLVYARERGVHRIAVREDAADAWTRHVMESVEGTLGGKAMEGWAYGANTPGKTVVFRSYGAGLPCYLEKLNASEVDGWDGFDLST